MVAHLDCISRYLCGIMVSSNWHSCFPCCLLLFERHEYPHYSSSPIVKSFPINRMSLPGAMSAGQVLLAASPFDGFLHIFNTNPYFIGIMMLLLNLGGRFIGLEVTKKQEQFLQHPWIRRVLIFTVLFMGTRSITVSFWATVVVVLLLGYLFNENSALCLFGNGGAKDSTCAEKPGEGMSPEEKEILQRLSSKAQRYANKDNEPSVDDDDNIPHNDVYAANVTLLRM
jgi:hypothetical protein